MKYMVKVTSNHGPNSVADEVPFSSATKAIHYVRVLCHTRSIDNNIMLIVTTESNEEKHYEVIRSSMRFKKFNLISQSR